MVPPTNTKELTMMMFIMTVTDTRFKPNDTDISQMVFTLTDTGNNCYTLCVWLINQLFVTSHTR